MNSARDQGERPYAEVSDEQFETDVRTKLIRDFGSLFASSQRTHRLFEQLVYALMDVVSVRDSIVLCYVLADIRQGIHFHSLRALPNESFEEWIVRKRQEYDAPDVSPTFTMTNEGYQCNITYSHWSISVVAVSRVTSFYHALRELRSCIDNEKRPVKQCDFDPKESRANRRGVMIHKHKAKQLVLMQKDYEEDHHPDDPFDTNLVVAVNQLECLLETEGYCRKGKISQSIKDVDMSLISKALHKFVEGHTLYNAHAIKRLHDSRCHDLPATSRDPLPVGDSRLVVVKAWLRTSNSLAVLMRPHFIVKQGFGDFIKAKLSSLVFRTAIDSGRKYFDERFEEVRRVVSITLSGAPYVLIKYFSIGIVIAIAGGITYAVLAHLLPLAVAHNTPIRQNDDVDLEPLKQNFIHETLNSFGSGLSKFVKGINDFSKFTISLRNITSFFKSLVDLMKGVIDWVSCQVTADRMPYFKSSRDVREFTDLILELSELTRDKKALTSDQAQVFMDKYNQASNMLSIIRTWPECSTERLLLTRTLTEGFEHYLKCKSQVAVNRTRVEPVVVMFVGVASAGKTSCKQMMTEYVYQRLFGQPLKVEQTYQRNGSQKHWDGYNKGVWSVTFDDIYQSNVLADRSLESLELIRCANIEPLKLNMASITEKDTTFFEPTLINLTSNIKPFSPDLGCTSSSAIWRRCHFVVSVSLKPGSKRSLAPSVEDSDNFVVKVYSHNVGVPDPANDFETDFVSFCEMVYNRIQDHALAFQTRSTTRDWGQKFPTVPIIEASTGRPLSVIDDDEEYFDAMTNDPLPVEAPKVWVRKNLGSTLESGPSSSSISSSSSTTSTAPLGESDDEDYPADSLLYDEPQQSYDDYEELQEVNSFLLRSRRSRKQPEKQCFRRKYPEAWKEIFCHVTDQPCFNPDGMLKASSYGEKAGRVQWLYDNPSATSFPTFIIDPENDIPLYYNCGPRRKYIKCDSYDVYIPSRAETASLRTYTDKYASYDTNPVLAALRDAFSSIEQVSMYAIGGVALGALCAIAVTTFGISCPSFFRQSEDPRSTHAHNTHRTTIEEAIRNTSSIPVGAKINVVHSAPVKQKGNSFGTKRIFHNIFFFAIKDGNDLNGCSFATFVDSHTAAIAAHSWKVKGDMIYLQLVKNQSSNNVYVVKKSDCVVTLFEDHDLALVTLPSGGWLPMKDLSRHIPDNYISHEIESVCRLGYNEDGSSSQMIVGPRLIPYIGVKSTVHIPETHYYVVKDTCGDSGDCGLPYFALNNGVAKKLVGFHVARLGTDSYVAPITQSMLQKHRSQVSNRFQQVATSFSITKPKFFKGSRAVVEPADSELLSMRVEYTTSIPPFVPNKTLLRPSPLQTGVNDLPPIWPSSEAPAKLTKNAMTNGFRKLAGKMWTHNQMFMDPEVWGGVFGSHFTQRAVEPLTNEQVFFGDPSLQIGSFPADSSNGYPWASEGITKEDLIVKPTPTTSGYIDERLLDNIKLREEHALKRKIIPVLCPATLKDELRPLDRVEKEYTRVMFPTPIDAAGFEKKYLGNFVQQLESTTSVDPQVKMNAYSFHWTKLATELRGYSDRLVAGDMDGWDIRTAIHMISFYLWVHIVIYFGLEPESPASLLIYSALMSASVPFIVIGNKVCLCPMQVSGRYSTSWLNSVANSVLTRICFKTANLRYKEKFPNTPLYQFHDVCRLLTAGDDNIMAVKPFIKVWWNGKVKAALFLELFFMHTTAPNKSPEIKEDYAFEEADFLSRRFIKDGSQYKAPLNEESMKNSILWVRKNNERSLNEQTIINIHNALFEWSLHGSAKYEIYRNLLNKYIRAMGHPDKQYLATWEQLNSAYIINH